MKLAIALLALPLVATTSAFTPASSPPFLGRRHRHAKNDSSSALLVTAVVTGFAGKPAATAEEDLMLTLRIIMDHELRSTTTSKEQYISQMTEISTSKSETKSLDELVDVSVPYDAAAQLAYNASDKTMAFEDFKQQYLADAVADVIAKQRQPKKPAAPVAAAPVVEATSIPAAMIDVSIPYDAPAALAYASSDKTMEYSEFKAKYEADAVADVMSKRQKSE
jgi:hypothetical protein